LNRGKIVKIFLLVDPLVAASLQIEIATGGAKQPEFLASASVRLRCDHTSRFRGLDHWLRSDSLVALGQNLR
jgi:hypothetical protein